MILSRILSFKMTLASPVQNQLEKLIAIGIALSAEKNLPLLLELILTEARALTSADAGTLYLVGEEPARLKFEIFQNDTLKVKAGGGSERTVNIPPVPLLIEGKPNLSHVSAFSANTGKIINIPDVYRASFFDFSGPKEYDARTGYRSSSMLVVPMKDHQDTVIGVLQLLNAKAAQSGEVIPFSKTSEQLTAAFASQAAVAINNTRLIQELSELLESFVQVIATAIDEKSPFTAGHIQRVTELVMLMAEKMQRFSPDELKELRLSAWMHDMGKIITPEYILDKASRLQGFLDGFEIIKTRFKLFEQVFKENPAELETLKTELEFIREINQRKDFLTEPQVEKLREIGQKSIKLNGEELPYLTPEELENLSVKRGNLNPKEREAIVNHSRLTYKMLSQLPFPRKLKNVPEYAASHHERLNGSGYPRGLKGEEIPFQARLIALADIFEALTAPDRPYKTPTALSKALQILGQMAKAQEIDGEVLRFFLKERLYLTYAQKFLPAALLDWENLPENPEDFLK